MNIRDLLKALSWPPPHEIVPNQPSDTNNSAVAGAMTRAEALIGLMLGLTQF